MRAPALALEAASVLAAPMSSTTLHPTAPRGRVGLGERFALGSGGLPMFLGLAAIGSFATPFYQMTLRLDPVWLAAALTVPRFLDAFIDPVVGRFSDNFHTRFGRRRPLVAFGAVIQALAFGMIWMVPPTWNQIALTSWLVATQIVFYIGYSFFSVPFLALQYEITPDYDERTRVSSFVGFFGKAGEIGYNYIFPIASSVLFVSVISGVRTLGWIVGIVFLGVVAFVPALFVRERYFHKTEKQETVRLLPGISAAFASRAFTILVGLTLLQIVAGMFASNLDRYILVYFLFDGNVALGETWKGHLSAAYAVVGILSIYPVTWLAQRLDKTWTLTVAFALVFAGAAGKWFLYTPGHEWKILLDPLLCGPVWIAINVLTPAMLADICDEDELRFGLRREGVFGAIFSWIQKTGYSTAFFGAFLSLKLTGFDAALGGAQEPSTILRLRLILTLSTAAWAVLAILLLRWYPLDRRRAHEIRAQLEARRGSVG
jgi:glycoside/pentoside/hexuronide:cation symporter, GPH family